MRTGHKVYPLKLFLDMVPSANITRALRGQAKRLSRNYRSRNGGNVIAYVLISFQIAEMFLALSAVFFVRPVCFVLVLLFIIWPFNRF